MSDFDGSSFAGSPSADTDSDAHAVHLDVYRRLGGRARVEIMFRLTDSVRALSMSGIRRRHPASTDEQVRMAYARLRLGDALMREIWPTRPLVDP
jgi:hypothetical protein